MFGSKSKFELTEEIEKNPEKYSGWVIASVGKKADKYKKLSRRYSILSVLLSLAVVFILSFAEVSAVTITASAFTTFNSVMLAWFQLEKPYERWRLYRKYHRLFEAERVKFLNEISPYDVPRKDKLLSNPF